MKEFRKEELVAGKYYSWVSDYNTDGGIFQFKDLNAMNYRIEYYLMTYGSTVKGRGTIANSNWDRFRELTNIEMEYYILVFAYNKLVPDYSSSKEFKKAYSEFTYRDNSIFDVTGLLEKVSEGDVLFKDRKVYCLKNNAWAKVVSKKEFEKLESEENVIIPAILMREGYIAMTLGQRNLFEKNVDAFTGETTKSFIIKYFKEECCGDWKSEMEKAFPFLITKEVDLSKIKHNEMSSITNDLLHVRNYGEFTNLGFYLNPDYNWEIKIDSLMGKILVPTKK